jgi:adenosylcobinamide amidohydrolase
VVCTAKWTDNNKVEKTLKRELRDTFLASVTIDMEYAPVHIEPQLQATITSALDNNVVISKSEHGTLLQFHCQA